MTKKYSKQISLGYDPMTGKRIRKRVYANSKTGLRQAENEANQDYGRHGHRQKITFGEYRDRWYAAYCETLTPNTQKTYSSVLKNFDRFENQQMSKIIRPDLQAVINDKWDKPSACHYIAFLANAIWSSAVDDGIIEKNIAKKLKRPKKGKSVRRALTEAELKGVKNADLDPMERFMVDVLQQFGLRPGEAFALNKQAFNRQDKTLTISKSLTHKGEHPLIKPTKTCVNRVLPVPDSFWSRIPSTKTLYYFTGESGQLMTRHEVDVFKKGILDKINEAMGGTDKIRATQMTLYYFRHTKATQLYYLPNVSFKAKAAYMGHSEQEFIRRYSHLDEEKEDQELLREAVI